jgi:CRISPR-associated protein Cmr1
LSARDEKNTEFKNALAAFWLLTELGGIGSRSRRCAGSLSVQSIKGDTEGIQFTIPANAQALKQQLEQGLNAVRKLYISNQRPTGQARFDALARETCRIWILQDNQPWQNAEIAMKEIGERLQDYRSHIPIGRRKIFGLPLMPIIRDQRRSSPLLLRVTRLQGNSCVGIAVLFKTIGGDIRAEDYKLIEEWIVKEFPKALEVKL